MCELFGISSAVKVQPNDLLKTFFSHSDKNPNGWGLAFFYGNAVSLEKEPLNAADSLYLKARLKHKMRVTNMMAHIRLATCGTPDYDNCHPFIMRDNHDRAWTLIHNGTIYNCPILDHYIPVQTGNTDSERIIYYIVDHINVRSAELGRALYARERFELLDGFVAEISPNNKLNLLIYDGEFLYIHTNCKNSLHVCQEEDTAYFATTPLDERLWHPVPLTTLCAYKDGKLVMTGTSHGGEFVEDINEVQC